MSKKYRRVLCALLMLCTLIGAPALAESTSVADRASIDDWKNVIFGEEDAPTTRNAGAIWVDKSVFTKSEAEEYFGAEVPAVGKDQFGNENFVVALSAIGSNSEVLGYSTIPTDTMIALDLSSSMYKKSLDPTQIDNMVNAVNQTIAALQSLNKNNRVGVTTYFGGHNVDNDLSTVEASCLLMLPLGRYTHSSNEFLSTTKNGKSELQSVQVNSGVKIEGTDTSVPQAKRSVVWSDGSYRIAGTYIQLGILSALNQFMQADPKVEEGIQVGQDRMPIMVLMSDGEPTAGSGQYTEMVTSEMGNNRVDDRNPAETDFVTQLTAAYARKKMDEHYVSSTPLFYTLSLGTSISLQVMDPSNNMDPTKLTGDAKTNATNINNYWNQLMNSGKNGITLNYYDYVSDTNKPAASTTVKKLYEGNTAVFPKSKNDMYYVDQMYTAETSGELTDAFGKIVQEIEIRSRYYGTHIESGDIHHDGYVEFADEIGGFMEVKSIKGLYYKEQAQGRTQTSLLDGSMFAEYLIGNKFTNAQQKAVYAALQKRLGINANQLNSLITASKNQGYLSYTDAGDFSNYLAWYADGDVKYMSPYTGGTNHGNAKYIVRSYVFMGRATDMVHDDSDSDWFYALVRVRENIRTGVQIVEYKLPASLLPQITYTITLHENENEVAPDSVKDLTSDIASKHPVSLLYEVGIDSDLKKHMLKEQLSDIGGFGVDYMPESSGKYAFYTNRWREWNAAENAYEPVVLPEIPGNIHTSEGNENTTVAKLTPSAQNELYNFVENTVIYADQNGTVYAGGANQKPTSGWYNHVVVSKENGNITTDAHYHQINSQILDKAKYNSKEGYWYIPAGTPYLLLHYNGDMLKGEGDNKTGSFPHVEKDVVLQSNNGQYHVYSFQGNNGRITVEPEQGLKIAKTVSIKDENAAAEPEFRFTIDLDTNDSRNYKTILLAADGTETTGTMSFASQQTISLQDGEAFYILGLPAGATYTVKEETTDGYVAVSADEASGTIAQYTISSASFENRWGESEDEEPVTFSGTKTLEGRPMIPGEFSFELYETGSDYAINGIEPLQTVDNASGGTFSFQPINYTITGKHYYVIAEKNLRKTGMIYDETKYHVMVEIRQDGDSMLETPVVTYTKDGVAANSVVFANTYTADGTELVLSGTKHLYGKDIIGGEFTFELYEAEYADGVIVIPENGQPVQSVQNDADGAYSFEALTYTQDDLYGENAKADYYYVVREKKESSIDGILFDYKDYHVHVQLTDDTEGALHTLVSIHESGGQAYVEKDKLDFHNDYVPTAIQGKIQGFKTLQGAPMIGGEFFFELYEADERFVLQGMPVETATNDVSGAFAFEAGVVLKNIGPNYFVVLEKAGKTPRMTYDQALYRIVIETEMNPANGKLSVKGEPVIERVWLDEKTKEIQTVAAEKIEFVNVYIPDISNIPETGDSPRLNLWLALLSISGLLLVLRRKRREA